MHCLIRLLSRDLNALALSSRGLAAVGISKFRRDLAHTSLLAARAHLTFPHRSTGRVRSPCRFFPLPLLPRSAHLAADLSSDFAASLSKSAPPCRSSPLPESPLAGPRTGQTRHSHPAAFQWPPFHNLAVGPDGSSLSSYLMDCGKGCTILYSILLQTFFLC
jgi:hypothetical protein